MKVPLADFPRWLLLPRTIRYNQNRNKVSKVTW